MDHVTMFRHIFEAFSSLSDAQDILVSPMPRKEEYASERISHAKLHLDAVAKSDLATWQQALTSGHLTCSLEEGGKT